MLRHLKLKQQLIDRNNNNNNNYNQPAQPEPLALIQPSKQQQFVNVNNNNNVDLHPMTIQAPIQTTIGQEQQPPNQQQSYHHNYQYSPQYHHHHQLQVQQDQQQQQPQTISPQIQAIDTKLQKKQVLVEGDLQVAVSKEQQQQQQQQQKKEKTTRRAYGKRSSKPLMEKRRRARINECLDTLKNYVLKDSNNLNHLGVDTTASENQDEETIARTILKSSGLINRHKGRKNPNKLEKADILELAVDYVRRLSDQRDFLLGFISNYGEQLPMYQHQHHQHHQNMIATPDCHNPFPTCKLDM